MIFGGLLAGGTGSRMESAVVPKQFIPVAGTPIFIRTLKTFLSSEFIDIVVVSTNADWEEEYTELMEEFNIDQSRVVLAEGGETRFLSLCNITKKASELCDDDSIIVTHDCARIFISKQIIENNIKMIASQKYDIVTTSIPVIDTVLQSSNGSTITGVPNRPELWNDQGPQTYKIKEFLNYFSKINMKNINEYIEASKLFIENDVEVGIVKGDRLNFKITNDIDLKYAEFLIREGIVS